jgi:hypothetical protein
MASRAVVAFVAPGLLLLNSLHGPGIQFRQSPGVFLLLALFGKQIDYLLSV